MADEITVEAEVRTALGKKTNALRRSGITPFHVYGPAIPSATLQADTYNLVNALNEAGFTTPLTVKVGSDSHFVIVQHIQRHPITDRLLHVDMLAISRTERITAAVPVHIEGESLAAREEGAQVVQDMYEVELEALPMEIPNSFTIDVSVLTHPDSAIHASDLELPPGVTLVTDPDAVVVRIAHLRGAAAVEEEAEAEEAAEEEAEAAKEGEAGEEGAEPVAEEGESKEEGRE